MTPVTTAQVVAVYLGAQTDAELDALDACLDKCAKDYEAQRPRLFCPACHAEATGRGNYYIFIPCGSVAIDPVDTDGQEVEYDFD